MSLLGQCDTAWLQQAYQVLIMGGRDLQYAPEPRVGFEMTMLRLLDFSPVVLHEETTAEETKPPRSDYDRVSTHQSSKLPAKVASPPTIAVKQEFALDDEDDPLVSQVSDVPEQKHDWFRRDEIRKEQAEAARKRELENTQLALAKFKNKDWFDYLKTHMGATFKATLIPKLNENPADQTRH